MAGRRCRAQLIRKTAGIMNPLSRITGDQNRIRRPTLSRDRDHAGDDPPLLSRGRPARWTAALLISLMWLVVVALAVRKLRQADGVIVALAGLGAAAITFAIAAWAERSRWREPIENMTQLRPRP